MALKTPPITAKTSNGGSLEDRSGPREIALSIAEILRPSELEANHAGLGSFTDELEAALAEHADGGNQARVGLRYHPTYRPVREGVGQVGPCIRRSR